MPLNFFEVGGIKNDKIGKNRCLVFMAESKKGHNFAIQGPTKKKTCSLIFCTDAIYKISSS